MVLAATLLLAACWTSHGLLLEARDGVDAVKSGIYVDGGTDKTRLVSKGHGWYVASDGSIAEDKAADDALPLMLARLPGEDRRLFVFAAGMGKGCVADHARCEGWVYGLLRVNGDSVDEALPDCDKTKDLALRFGAKNDGGSGDPCDFQSRDDLMRALSAYGQTPGAFEKTIRRQ
jgi:hypothetical protein